MMSLSFISTASRSFRPDMSGRMMSCWSCPTTSGLLSSRVRMSSPHTAITQRAALTWISVFLSRCRMPPSSRRLPNRQTSPIHRHRRIIRLPAYVSYQVQSTDGKAHDVQLYLEATSAWATNVPGQAVKSSVILKPEGLMYATTGTTEQPVLQTKGDDVRIDWGHFFLAAAQKESVTIGASDFLHPKKEFATTGNITRGGNIDDPNQEHSLALVDNLGSVKDATAGYAMIAYDDDYAIQYFNDNRMAYWKHNGQVSIDQALLQAVQEYESIMQRCREFDEQLIEDTKNAGGQQYAELCALVYRQIIAAHKLVEDKNGNLLFFSKENFSNGSIGTVDITYPSAPLFLVYNPELLKGMMNFIFEYSESGRWQKPFAAHDVGTYPQANGQTYGGDMPVEEKEMPTMPKNTGKY